MAVLKLILWVAVSAIVLILFEYFYNHPERAQFNEAGLIQQNYRIILFSSQCCLQTFYADIVLPCCVERHLFLQALQLQVSCHRWCSIIGVTLMMVWGSMIRLITTTVWPGLSIHWIKMRQPCFEYSLMVCKTGFLQPTRHTLLGTSQARTDLLTHLTDLTFDRLLSWHSCQDSNYPICCNHSNGRIFLPREDRHLPSNLQDGRHQEK